MDRHIVLRHGERLLTFPGDRRIVIGQTEGCDVWLKNSSEYEDVLLAKIELNSDGQGWHLVRINRYYPVRVNGRQIDRVHYLADGDQIEVCDERIKFETREGEQISPTVTHLHKGGKMMWALGAVVLGIAMVTGYMLYSAQRDKITSGMRQEIAESIFSTRVDSVQLIHNDTIVESYAYASSPVGTAFLTTDSLLVTARHCLQPWLNMVLPHEYGKIPGMGEWPVQRALFAETRNQLDGDDAWRMVSYLTLTDEHGKSFTLTSDDFTFNTESDDIVELGDYDHPQYWRSISHRYSRRDMMLGDIAGARMDHAGQITLASKGDLREMLSKRGVTLTFVGHPESSVNGNQLDFKNDELRLPIEEMAESPGRLFMIAHEGGLTPGFSGGPVIVRSGSGFKCVGVISVIDGINGNRAYSVPVSELDRR